MRGGSRLVRRSRDEYQHSNQRSLCIAKLMPIRCITANWYARRISQAPAPLKCGPKSKFPTTGFWDFELGRENNADAYANARGRVDVEGCCWWGRGVIQTRG
jgi:hypothetical protein